MVAPGGGNIMLMYGVEGMEIAERYNEWGVSAFVLTYRLVAALSRRCPHAGRQAGHAGRAQPGFAVPARPREGRVHRVLGGLDAGAICWRPTRGPADPNAADPIDRLSSRPDYLGLVYGPGRVPPGETLKKFPPTFLLSAQLDTGNAVGSAQLFAELTRAGVTAEIHIYQKGRHGFGSAFATPIYSDWMGRLQRFLQAGGFMPGGN